MKKVRVALIGAGNRGTVYSEYAEQHPAKMEIVAVAEPDESRRKKLADRFQLQEKRCFQSWEDMFSLPRFCDAVIITTQDQMHFEPTMHALEKGYHVLVEKPMSHNLRECILMERKAREKGRLLMVCYVLRYTPFFQKIKEIIKAGVIGEVRHVGIEMDVGYWHMAHSFVRGNWNNQATSCSMVLAKSCHDFDILSFLLDARCESVSSFGDLIHFQKANAPTGSSNRCLDCVIENECPYSAVKIYLGENIEWPVSTISSDLSMTGRRKALEEGPYGKCVYRCNNDVVDHQIVNMEFSSGTTATLTMSGFTQKLKRTVKILGTKGEVQGTMEENELTVLPFGKDPQHIKMQPSFFGKHAGGDAGLMEAFVHDVSLGLSGISFPPDERLVESHILAHAAEESRLSKRTVNIEEYKRQTIFHSIVS
ncbi:Gfo/Idh/MocA family protein [Bacillus sp. FJAT-44742]|uniref:Gfo/Idh/MocA family protein n=1 Tax=Bacillus sp. FJAT-44742 TaxID=2014005 RepID=UPI000C23F489|nr:Gfo/Idh/MocA family oxidoreductase [Bacillus sp. FJAT-44742]